MCAGERMACRYVARGILRGVPERRVLSRVVSVGGWMWMCAGE